MTLRRYAQGVLISTALIVSGVFWHNHRIPYIAAEDMAEGLAAAIERRAAANCRTMVLNKQITDKMPWISEIYDANNEPFVTPHRLGVNLVYTLSALRETLRAENDDGDATHWLDGVGNIPEDRAAVASYVYTGAVYSVVGSGSYSNIIYNTPTSYNVHPFVTLDTRFVRPDGQVGQFPHVFSATNIPARRLFGPFTPLSEESMSRFISAAGNLDSWWRNNVGAESFMFRDLERIVTTNKFFSHRLFQAAPITSPPGEVSYVSSDTKMLPYFEKEGLDRLYNVVDLMRTTIDTVPAFSGTQTVFNVVTNLSSIDPSTSSELYAELTSGFSDYWTAFSSVEATYDRDRVIFSADMLGEERDDIAFFYGETIDETGDFTNSYAELRVGLHRYDLVFQSVPAEAYASNLISRVRIFLCAETSTPVLWTRGAGLDAFETWWMGASNITSVVGAGIDANLNNDMGYELAMAAMPSDHFPHSTDFLNFQSPAYMPINRVWTLVLNVEDPTEPPALTIAPNPSFPASSPYALSQCVKGWVTPTRYREDYFRFQTIRIVRAIAIVDWRFNHLNSLYSPPANIYSPAWTTNAITEAP